MAVARLALMSCCTASAAQHSRNEEATTAPP
jgi:hypothetical protein